MYTYSYCYSYMISKALVLPKKAKHISKFIYLKVYVYITVKTVVLRIQSIW